MTPYECRRAEQGHSSFMCMPGQQKLVNPSEVFTQQIVQVDSSFGGHPVIGTCPHGDAICSAYADCNPDLRNASDTKWTCSCVKNSSDPHERHRYSPTGGVDQSTCNVTGKVDVRKRYCGEMVAPIGGGPSTCTICADECYRSGDGCPETGCVWKRWKSLVAEITGGFWYSTPAEAACDAENPHGSDGNCAWQILETVKIVNATCVFDRLHHAVEARAKSNAGRVGFKSSCFAPCATLPGGGGYNRTSDCYVECFVETVTGRDAIAYNTSAANGAVAMSAEEINTPLADALRFGEGEGGCAGLPPYVPP